MSSAPRRFRKKPVEIEAIRWTGDNAAEVKSFVGYRDNGESRFLLPSEITGRWEHPAVWEDNHAQWIGVLPGYWVVRGTQGEFYPCDPDAFAATYEPIVNEAGEEPTTGVGVVELPVYVSVGEHGEAQKVGTVTVEPEFVRGA